MPLAVNAARVKPMWHRLTARARRLGWRIPEPQTTHEPELHLLAGSREIRPVCRADGRFVFMLPIGPGPLRLRSRSTVPSVLRPWIDDRRRLGVMVQRLTLRAGDAVEMFPLDHPALRDGWWAIERDAHAMWRWTNGDAVLPLAIGTASFLEVERSLWSWITRWRRHPPNRACAAWPEAAVSCGPCQSASRNSSGRTAGASHCAVSFSCTPFCRGRSYSAETPTRFWGLVLGEVGDCQHPLAGLIPPARRFDLSLGLSGGWYEFWFGARPHADCFGQPRRRYRPAKASEESTLRQPVSGSTGGCGHGAQSHFITQCTGALIESIGARKLAFGRANLEGT